VEGAKAGNWVRRMQERKGDGGVGQSDQHLGNGTDAVRFDNKFRSLSSLIEASQLHMSSVLGTAMWLQEGPMWTSATSCSH